MLGTFTSYQLMSRDIPAAISRVADQPFEAREVKYYLDTIKDIKSVDEFVDNSRIFAFAMKAHGLGEMTYAKAFMKKVLNEGIGTNSTFANTLSDTRYRDFAEAFNFEQFKETATVFESAGQETVDKYLRQTLEEQAGSENEGVRLALYFERKAPNITSFYQVLADPALATVVRTSIGLPESTAAIDIDRQVELISNRLELDDLSDPEKLSNLLERFTSLWDINNPTTAPSTPGLLIGSGNAFGISQSTLLSISQLKRR